MMRLHLQQIKNLSNMQHHIIETGVANDEDETKGSDGTISNTTLYRN